MNVIILELREIQLVQNELLKHVLQSVIYNEH